ncbi:hypothetical protein DSUL_140043 [Desulfovibrionales bacterium]
MLLLQAVAMIHTAHMVGGMYGFSLVDERLVVVLMPFAIIFLAGLDSWFLTNLVIIEHRQAGIKAAGVAKSGAWPSGGGQ